MPVRCGRELQHLTPAPTFGHPWLVRVARVSAGATRAFRDTGTTNRNYETKAVSMSAGETPVPGHVQVLVEAGKRTRFQPGKSGNPEGRNHYEITVRKAIQRQESPERVCAVVQAMFEDACAHGPSSPAAAKVYAMLVGAEPNDTERIIKGVAAHLDGLMREAERLEAIEHERKALPEIEK